MSLQYYCDLKMQEWHLRGTCLKIFPGGACPLTPLEAPTCSACRCSNLPFFFYFTGLESLSVVNLSRHLLFINNSFDFAIGSSKTCAKSFDSFAILSLQNDPYWNICSLTTPSCRVNLPRTVCWSVCSNIGKMAPLVHMNYSKISFPFGIEFHITKNIRERRLSLNNLSGIAHCTWLSLDRKYKGNFSWVSPY